ncbi:hypothetical protein F5883DRAFT_584986, partial [Diaporthe sp. PMI_573]
FTPHCTSDRRPLYGMAVATSEQPLLSPWSDPALVLVDHQLKRVDKLRRDLATCGSGGERAVICRRTRDDLLREHHSLGILFAVCRDVMKASEQSFDEPDELWKRFTELANKGAKTRARCIKALEVVAGRWGHKLAHHYGWGAMGPGFCDQLRAAAREMDWPTFVRSLNTVLLDRHKSRTPEVAHIPALVNSITHADIVKVRNQVQPGKVPCARLQRAEAKDPAAQKKQEAGHRAAKAESENRYRTADCLPAVLGLDRFGVVVRKKFDDPPTVLMNAFLGVFHAEVAQPLPANLTNAKPAAKNLLLPPSPPSSPNSGTTTSLPSTGAYEQGPHYKRASPTHSDQPTKKQRTRLPRLSAAVDARRVYDVLAELQSQGSPLANQPQFAQFLEWAKEESEKDEGSHTAASHHHHSAAPSLQAATITRHAAPSFLEQVLAPSPGSHSLGQSSQDAGSATRPLTSIAPLSPNIYQLDTIDTHRWTPPVPEQVLSPASTSQGAGQSLQHAPHSEVAKSSVTDVERTVALADHIPQNGTFDVTVSSLIEHGRGSNAALHVRHEQDRATQSNSMDSRVLDHTEHEHITLRTGKVATSVSSEYPISYRSIATGLTT